MPDFSTANVIFALLVTTGAGLANAGFGLPEEVRERGMGHVPPGAIFRPRDRRDAMRDGEVHQPVIRRMKLDLVDASAVAIEGGSVTEVQAVGIDITARKLTETAERERSQVLALVAMVNQRFIDLPPDEVDTGINAALADMARALNVDRAYVVRYRADREHLDMTHEWCAPGVDALAELVKGSSDTESPRVRERLLAGESIHIDAVSELGDDWIVEGLAEYYSIELTRCPSSTRVNWWDQ